VSVDIERAQIKKEKSTIGRKAADAPGKEVSVAGAGWSGGACESGGACRSEEGGDDAGTSPDVEEDVIVEDNGIM